jgi:hypothetical protein
MTRLRWMGCIVLLACGPSAAPEEPSPAAPSEGAEQPAGQGTQAQPGAAPDTPHHMNRSFWAAVAVRNALMDGNLDEAKRQASTLAQQDFGGYPDDWRRWVAAIQKEAGDIAVAGDVHEAGRSLALLATACGGCHLEKNTGPAVAELQRPDAETWKDEELTDRMKQHFWAENELWFGLVTPSELGWRRGARGLAHTFLTAPDDEGKPVSEPTHEALLEVRKLGEEASKAGTTQLRAELYGKLLAKCGDCHQQTARE